MMNEKAAARVTPDFLLDPLRKMIQALTRRAFANHQFGHAVSLIGYHEAGLLSIHMNANLPSGV